MAATFRRQRVVQWLARAVLVVAMGVPISARAQAPDDEVIFHYTDAVGSARMTTNGDGTVVERYDYPPFGEPFNVPTSPDTRQFAGKERDAETGLDYFGARYYSSQTGRFTTVDPVLDVDQARDDPQRWNRYAYSLTVAGTGPGCR